MPKLSDLLAAAPQSFIKDADVESPDEAQLEQDFANMAFMFLRDRAQSLMPYLLGFEVVDREEDGSRAVGIFGFKIADKYYYVPAFFINNQIKGMDLLYSKDTNTFMPLRETWVNHILNKATLRLGESAPSAQVRSDFETPNFEFLAEPPYGVKNANAGVEQLFSEEELEKIAKKGLWDNVHAKRERGESPAKPGDKDYPDAKEWKKNTKKASEIIDDAFDVWNDLQGAAVEGLHKDAEFQQAWAGAMSRLQDAELDLEKSAGGSPIVAYMEQHGGPKAVEAFMHAVQEPKFANALFEFYPDLEQFKVTEFSSDLAPKKAQENKVVVIADPVEDMTGKERKRLIRDGFSIVDRREQPDKSELFSVDYSKRFISPPDNGVFNMLLPSGNTVKTILMHPADNQPGRFVTCVEPKNKFYFTADSDSVFVAEDEKYSDETPYDFGEDLKTIEVGKRYVLVNAKGYSSAPFQTQAIVAENGSRTRVRVIFGDTVDYSERDVWSGRPAKLRPQPPYYDDSDIKYLQLTEHEGGTLKQSGENLMVPQNWKVIPLISKWEYYDLFDSETKNDAGMEGRDAYDAFAPGSLTDLNEAMYKSGFHNLIVDGSDGIEFHIHLDEFTDGPFRYKSAFCRLVQDYGLSVDDAENCLEKAARDFKSRHLVKLAQVINERSMMTPVDTQLPPVPVFGSEDLSGMSMPEDIPYAETQEGTVLGPNSWQDTTAPGFAVGGQSESEMGNEAMALAEQAAASGQKNVFDHATIGGLARMYDSSAAIDTYLPELTRSLDRIGRILFIFYWKNEDFAERYGEEDLAEMEDLLRGVFKSFGDLLLKLKQKSIMPEDSSEVLAI